MEALLQKKDNRDINRKLRYLFLILIFLLPTISFFVAYMLYNTALMQKEVLLFEMVKSQVQIIESVAKFDAIHSQDDHQQGAEGATISQIEHAFKNKGFGETGEFVFAKLHSGKMDFYFPPRLYKAKSLVVDMDRKIPMREALLGKEGVTIGTDYRGEKVLAAYAPVPLLKSGIVAKIDLAEIRKPYIHSFLIATGISSLFSLIGIFIFLGITNKIKDEIRERQMAEDELFKLRKFLSNIIDSMPSILIGIDTDCKVTHWNKEAEKITEINAENAIDKPLSEVFPRIALDSDEILESIRTSRVKLKTNISNKTEAGIKFEDITVYPLVTNGVNGVVVRIDDVTKKRMMEEQLNQSRKLDAIGQLAGGVAHDFNNMLCGIMGAASLLKSSLNDPEDLEFVDLIDQAAKQSADLTSKLLAFGRKSNVPFNTIDIHKIIDDTVTILKRTVDKMIIISVSKNDTNSKIVGDNSEIQNVLMNLGINSSHSMPEGGTIQIETSNINLNKDYCIASTFNLEPGEYIQIEVKDEGCGIPTENLQRIFEPFFTTSEKGTGLGLPAVYGIIQDHHGAINVYSEEGKGTVFHLYLPCASEDSESKQIVDEELVPGSGFILLVDDEKIIRKVGKKTLERIGYDVLLAENGLEAIEIFKKNYDKIDLVILDMIMPNMNGRQTFLKMKEIDKKCKVIISSGFWKNGDVAELKEKGLAGFIRKPFMGPELSQMVHDILNS